MNRLYHIKRNGDTWKFSSEAALEDFIWDHLEEIFNLKPLKRQHHADGNFCDILAIADKKQLVIVELKNTEDRYVVQQLTRYYHMLLQEKPFSDQVDYQIPASLVILSPNFHKDNHIDCLYHQLKFDLFQFSVDAESKPTFRAKNLQTGELYEFEIPYTIQQDVTQIREISPPSKSFKTALARCLHYDSTMILEAREKILSFDERIQETQVKPGYFSYGKGKTKPLADFTTKKYRISDSLYVEYPVLALWLPISFRTEYRFSRVTLPSNLFCMDKTEVLNGLTGRISENGKEFWLASSDFQKLCQKGIGRMQKITQEWDIKHYLWLLLRKELNRDVSYENLPKEIKEYCCQHNLCNAAESNVNLLNFFINFALKRWLEPQ